MRDITKDLKQRIAELDIEIKQIKQELDPLMNRRNGLQMELEAEGKRWQSQKGITANKLTSLPIENTNTLAPAEYLLNKINDTEGKNLPMLKMEADKDKYDFGKAAPGRAIHQSLVSLAKKGLAEKRDNLWYKKLVTN